MASSYLHTYAQRPREGMAEPVGQTICPKRMWQTLREVGWRVEGVVPRKNWGKVTRSARFPND